MRKGVPTALLLALAMAASAASIAGMASAGSGGLSAEWIWCDGDSLPAGRASSVNLTIWNSGPNEVKIRFVGLRFDWMPQNTYLYGGGSELEVILPPKGSAKYAIAFEVPPNAAPGPHDCSAFAKYEALGEERLEIFRPYRGLSVIRVVTLTEVVTKTETVAATEGQGYGNAPLAVLGLAVAAIALLLAKLRLRGRPGGGTAGGRSNRGG